MKLKNFSLLLITAISVNAWSIDQCNFTSECKTTYGPSATDCVNSKTDHSVCYCGANPCDETGGGVDNTQYFAVPGIIQAEDYNNAYDTSAGNSGRSYKQDNVDIQPTSDSGGGYNVGWITTGEWLEYPIDIQTTGNYQIALRTAAKNTQGIVTIELDAGALASGIKLPVTNAWQSWQTTQVDLGKLSAGKHILRMQVVQGGFNVNWMALQLKTGNGEDLLGHFDRNRDLLLAMFDSKPDPDDIHSVAGLGTMLKDSRFSKVNFHAVSGAYGIQGGDYIEASQLFDLAFGAANWSNAHSQYQTTLDKITQLTKSALQAGGDIWVQEAGQSDLTADLVRNIKADLPGVNTQARIHVVQHSNWNENKTSPEDLAYVKQQTDYHKIADGNSSGNGTPGFNTKDTSRWAKVTSNPAVGAIWSEAKRVADKAIANHTGWANPTIRDGGFDFSDVVEDTWIFGFNGLKNTNEFFNTFIH